MIRWWSVRLWGAHLLGLVCVAAATGMGIWQYDAWQARREAERVDLTQAEPVPLTDVIGPDDPFPTAGVGRPVTLDGTWLPEGTVLITDREGEAGHDGRWVVTPMTVGTDAGAPAVPVVRGWVPADVEVDDLPPLTDGHVATGGWLQPPEGSAVADEDPSDDVLPRLRIADLVQRVEVDLYGAYVVADDVSEQDEAAGLAPASLDQLPPVGRFTALRNLLYAIEWWVFAAFAGFIWWRYVRDTTNPPPPEEAGPDDQPEGAVPSGS